MATKKRGKPSAKKTKSRRRSVGAMKINPNSNAVKFIAAGIGFVAADKVNVMVDKIPVLGTQETKIKRGIQTAGGGYLLMRRKKAGLMGMAETFAGGLLAGAGIKGLLQDFGVLSGFKNVPVLGGFNAVPVLGQPMPRRLGAYNTNPAAASLAGYNTNPAASMLAGKGSSHIMAGANKGQTRASNSIMY